MYNFSFALLLSFKPNILICSSKDVSIGFGICVHCKEDGSFDAEEAKGIPEGTSRVIPEGTPRGIPECTRGGNLE